MSITFVAPAYLEKFEPLMFIGCLLAQTNPDWEVIIYHNGHNNTLKAIVEGFKDERLHYYQSEENTGNWGCYNRQHALQDLIKTEYILQTSIQDYFIPKAVEEILKYKEDLILWNSINHIFGYSHILDSEPRVGRADWGNFVVKTELAKQVGINHPTEFCADGIFIQDLLKSGLIKSTYKINSVLTIHN